MEKINLQGKWSLENCTTKKIVLATLSGSDFGNLIKCGEIENPLIYANEEETLKTAKNDFMFSRTVDIDETIFNYKHINFMCDSLDTLCSCYINNSLAFESANAYIPADFDIKEYLKPGENEIKLYFHSAYNYIVKKQNESPLPKNFNGIDGAAYIRKSACHFGWDWGPCIPYNAVGENLCLNCFNERIENIKISQRTTKEISTVTVTANGAKNVYIITPNKERINCKCDNDKPSYTFNIENPELWYTRELSQKDKQPLYTVVFEGSEETVKKKIGLRSLYLSTAKDEYLNDFCFVLNGERIFAKGANIIPFSAIYEDSSNDDIDFYLDLAVKSNFNIVRIWGGGFYASEYFLNRCDELGLLVWQDFCFACMLYPFYDKEFLCNVLAEVEANTLRMSTHACLALWCGNNEIESMFSYMPKTNKLIKCYEEFFYHTLPEFIKDKTDTSYIPTSPLGSSIMKENTADKCGDTHMWNVWHGLKNLNYYQKRYSHFLSEYGLESLPSMKAISTFASGNQLSITSSAFNSHQKCVGGNKKMMFYLTEMFNEPKNFDALPYLTGIVQSECIKNATVHFRQNKGRCNGSIYWQYNDVWNCPSWSSVDFEKQPKALQFKAKEFFDPITVSCKKEKGRAFVFAHNDTLFNQNFNVTTELFSGDTLVGKKQYSLTLEKGEFKRLDTYSTKNIDIIRISFNGKTITEITKPPCKMNLQKVDFKTELLGNKLKIKANNFAYEVCVQADELPKENYFSMLKGEEKIIEFDNTPSHFDIICANNIEYKNHPIAKKLYRFAYRLKPMNIANYFYYSYN